MVSPAVADVDLPILLDVAWPLQDFLVPPGNRLVRLVRLRRLERKIAGIYGPDAWGTLGIGSTEAENPL